MTKIYFKPYSNSKQEANFFQKLAENFESYEHIKEDYNLPHSMLSNYLNTNSLIDKLNFDRKLSTLKRQRLLAVLKTLPEELKVARKISDVSVDFVICRNKSISFIEFHEKQHRNISDKRLKPVFTKNDERFEIPRYALRFLKDVWRLENLKNFKIVWWDWFLKNQYFDINESDNEFHLKEKFNFNGFMEN